MPFRTALLDLELVEDRLRVRIARRRRHVPLCSQPRIKLLEPVVGIERAPHDELGRNRSVPVVFLQAERDVVPADTPVTVELRSLPERDRAARVASVAIHAEAQMLAV